ncbi:MAG: DMT family transporter [Desulfobulbus sp.]
MRHYLFALGAICCWASLPVATGSGLDGLSTDELLFYSFWSGAIFLYLLDILKNRTLKLHFPGFKTSFLGIWGIFIYHYTYYSALERAPIAEAAILATTWSFWIVVFSSWLRLRRLKVSIVLTALICLGGAGLVMGAGKTLAFENQYLVGYLLALGCGLIWSSFSLGLSLAKPSKDPMTIFMGYAALLSTVLFVVSGPHPLPGMQSLAAAVYLGCVPLGLSFFLWNRAVVGGNMIVIGYLSYLTPPLAVLLVALVRGEAVSLQVLVGMTMIIAAAIMGQHFLKRTERAK